MTTPLAERHCVVCKPGTPALSRDAVARFLEDLPAWSIREADGHLELTRSFRFKGFLPGVDLVNRFASVAEAEGHHPDLVLSYGSLAVRLWTHTARGLTENDFILAAKLAGIAAL
ncbi:MAG TPA: 4a-hydroxytetrahydrobiopterin dehydratase [Candidatus Baltobacterales bacterium]|nr:4a-hydroxytetrahydrobiopterin dehydratase [Candidatus Baltobacterales bacterium]